MRALRSMAVVGSALAAALALGIGSAYADPPSGTVPATTDIVAGGSDTFQDLGNKWSTDYNSTSPSAKFYSWNATGSTPIQTKNDSNCANITRPNGSSAGINQVHANLQTSNGLPCLDIARASRPLSGSDPAGLVSADIGTDIITMAEISGGNGAGSQIGTADNPDSATVLQAIYECNASLINSADSGPVTWAEIGGTGPNASHAIQPILPQNGSGTRATFLADINVTASTIGSCVHNGTAPDNSVIEENEGTNSIFTTAYANYLDDLFPYSAGDYICQVFHSPGTCTDIHGSQALQDLDGVSALTTDSPPLLNDGFGGFTSTFIRQLYLVTLNAGTKTNPAWPSRLQAFLTWACGTTGQADVQSFGFDVPGNNCGFLQGT